MLPPRFHDHSMLCKRPVAALGHQSSNTHADHIYIILMYISALKLIRNIDLSIRYILFLCCFVTYGCDFIKEKKVRFDFLIIKKSTSGSTFRIESLMQIKYDLPRYHIISVLSKSLVAEFAAAAPLLACQRRISTVNYVNNFKNIRLHRNILTS